MGDDLLTTLFAKPWAAFVDFLNHHGALAFLLLLLYIAFWQFPKALGAIDLWKARILWPLAKWLKFRFLVRAATKYDVRGHVNKAVNKLSREVPKGWLVDLDLQWVDKETPEQFFHENKIVVRVRPMDRQEENFVIIVHHYLSEALFGNVRRLIPAIQRTAAVLYFGDRISRLRGENACQAFGERIFEPTVQGKQRITEYFQRYSELDDRGFFTGPFLREVHHVATEVRQTRWRQNMATEMNEALTHLEDFRAAFERSRLGGTPVSETAWQRRGILTKYALLLVAHPGKAAFDVDAAGYVSRAQRDARQGVRRLYVLGSSGEREFARTAIKQIVQNTPYELEQEFELYRDYRGDPGGIGACLIMPDGASAPVER
jgi:hypothetical protein